MADEINRGKVERRLISLAAAMAVAVSLLDQFGVPHMTFVEPFLTPLILFMIVVIVQFLQSHHDKVEELLQLASDTQLSNVAALRVDADLRNVCSDYFYRLNSSISCLKDGNVLIYGRENLRPCYNKTLEMYPKSTFYATSIASEAYFWTPGTYENSVKAFIDTHGRMERIFFVEHDAQRLSDEEMRVIKKHLELGVKIFVIGENHAPHGSSEFFLVESKGKIAWRSEIGGNKVIHTSTASSNPEFTRHFVKSYLDLKKLATEVKG